MIVHTLKMCTREAGSEQSLVLFTHVSSIGLIYILIPGKTEMAADYSLFLEILRVLAEPKLQAY